MRFLSLIAAAAFAAVPAAAIDLTGTWVGTFNCTEFDGEKHKFSQKGEILLITQVGNELNIEWVGLPPTPIAGIVINDVKKPDEKGAAALVDCDTTTDLTTDYAELANLTAKVNRPKGKGSLKGTSVYNQDGDATGQCKWSFKLTDTADPGVAATCP